MVELLKDNRVTLPHSDSLLFSILASSAEETCGKVEDPVRSLKQPTELHSNITSSLVYMKYSGKMKASSTIF
jgi:hypothetical protein